MSLTVREIKDLGNKSTMRLPLPKNLERTKMPPTLQNLKTKQVHDHHRAIALAEAILECITQADAVPEKWMDELKDLLEDPEGFTS